MKVRFPPFTGIVNEVWLGLIAAATAGLSVHVAGGADPCALESRVPEALGQWMPAGGDDVLSLALAPNGPQIRLTLTSSAGDTLLSRAVPLRLDACTATADGISLVVETYLQDVGWQPAAPDLPPDPEAAPAEAASAEATEEPATVKAVATSPLRVDKIVIPVQKQVTTEVETATRPSEKKTVDEPRSSGEEVASTSTAPSRPAGPAGVETIVEPQPPSGARADAWALALGVRGLFDPVPDLRYGGAGLIRVGRRRFGFTAEGGVRAPQDATAPGATGAFRVTPIYAAAGADGCLFGDLWAACLHGRTGVERSSVSGSDVLRASTDTRILLVALAGARMDLDVHERVTLSASADVFIRPERVQYTLEGTNNTFQFPAIAGSLAIGGRVRIF